MKQFKALLLLILVSCAKDEVDPPMELFANTNVEAGTNVPEAWWSNANGTDAVFNWSDQEAYSESRSLEISSSVDGLANVAYWGQTVITNIPVGKDLTLNVRIKSNVTGAGAAVAIACLNASSITQAQQFSTTQGTSAITGNADWTSYTVKLENVQSDITEIRVYLMLLSNSTGKVYFDDITLTAK